MMEQADKVLCGAALRGERAGKFCKNPPVTGSERCRMHGGKSLKGVEAPGYIHGRLSKVIPKRMLEDLEDADNDAQLASLRENILIASAREVDLMKRVDTGESGNLWKLLGEAQREVDRLVGQASTPETIQELEYARTEMRSLIIDGTQDYQAWDEYHAVVDRKMKLLAAERRRILDLNQFVPAERVMALFTAVMNIMRRNVKDRDTIVAISREAYALINTSPPRNEES